MSIPVILQVIDDWHTIIDMVAEILDVPAVLIRRFEEESIELLASSSRCKDVFHLGQREILSSSNLFCVQVYETRKELLLANAMFHERYQDCSDAKLGYLSYLGYPIFFPSGDVFGTICILDKKENQFGPRHRRVLTQSKSVIENHLALAERHFGMESKLAETAILQGMIPVCINCHKLRTDTTNWSHVDEFLADISEAFFPKCLCPDCTSSITALLEQTGSPISKLERLLTEYLRAFSADAAYLALLDGEVVVPVVGCVTKESSKRPIDEELCRKVISTSCKCFNKQPDGAHTLYSFCQPLSIDDTVIGVIYSRGTEERLLDSSMNSLLVYAFAQMAEEFLRLKQTRSALIAAAAMRVGREVVISSTKKAVFGSSAASVNLLKSLEAAAGQQVTVLLTGETGTGKEIAARTIHNLSEDRNGPFVALNCSAIPRDLIEAELFGVEVGAFTGAQKCRRGRFEQANKGTLFLDEIGELTADIQVTLLRVLEERSVCRLGGSLSLPVDFRLVAATNSDLETLVASGDFRQDLYFRLNVFRIEVPPLRMRRDDIMPLARHFLDLSKQRLAKHIDGFTPDAEQFLVKHTWPGNVRELRNVIERAVVVSDGRYVDMTALQISPLRPSSSAILSPTELPAKYDDAKEVFERLYIERALQSCGFGRSERLLSKITGLARTTLRRKLEKFGLHEEFLKKRDDA